MCPLITILDRYDGKSGGGVQNPILPPPLVGSGRNEKHDSDVGMANIRCSVLVVDAAVGRVAVRSGNGRSRQRASQFRSALVDDSQTSGVRCPGYPDAFL